MAEGLEKRVAQRLAASADRQHREEAWMLMAEDVERSDHLRSAMFLIAGKGR